MHTLLVTFNPEALRRFCSTPRQSEVLDAYVNAKPTRTRKGNGDGRITAAAAALGVARTSVTDVLRILRKRAAIAGYAPENRPPWAQELPTGHRIKGMSTRVDGAGEVDQQWAKTEREPDPSVARPIVPEGHHVVRQATQIGRQGEVITQWVSTDHEKAAREAAFWEAARAAVAEFTPLPPLRASTKSFRESLTVYPLGDPHFGMLSWAKETGVDFDTRIAQEELAACVDELVSQAPPSRDAHLVNIGDARHAEDDRQVTPKSANKLDVDTRSAKVTRIWLESMLRLAVRLLEHHERVRIFNLPGNHDPTTAFMSSLWLEQAFKDNPRVVVSDACNPYQYFRYGKVLLGYAHGDGAKDADLLPIMATDCGPGGIPGFDDAWGKTFYRHWIEGHVHHDKITEFRGGIVEHIRTLASRDLWHHHSGYRSGRSLKAITFDPEFGERSRTVCDIRRVRNLLETAK